MIKVLGVMRDDGACMLYRIKQPLSKLQDKGLADVSIAGFGSKVDFDSAVLEADIIHIPRVNCYTMKKLIETVQPLGKKIIIDQDDDIFNVNPLSEWYRDYGIEEIEIDGVKLWKDGNTSEPRSIDIEKNIEKREVARECMRMADSITVTTEELAKVYQPYNDNIKVLPNCIDFKTWMYRSINKDEKITIGWQGGDSHYQDLMMIKSPLVKVLNKYKDKVKFIMCGAKFDGFLKDIPNTEHYPWESIYAHPYRMSLLGFDIGIIPIKHDEFNKGKSAIKFHEYSALSTATLASNYLPYSEVIKDGMNGYLFKDEKEFEEKLTELIESFSKRQVFANNAYKDTSKNYDADSESERWFSLYESLYQENLVMV
jgi:glycosyltransferase involved in cell wall biosynthesis|tara:strand:- start:292 stop:1401 length:1110 start_codon:yes stop_codon:yes gene_type:complete